MANRAQNSVAKYGLDPPAPRARTPALWVDGRGSGDRLDGGRHGLWWLIRSRWRTDKLTGKKCTVRAVSGRHPIETMAQFANPDNLTAKWPLSHMRTRARPRTCGQCVCHVVKSSVVDIYGYRSIGYGTDTILTAGKAASVFGLPVRLQTIVYRVG